MKAAKLVHPSHARTVLSEDDAARLRQAGWLELKEPKSVSRSASLQRRFRQRQILLGNRQLLVWLPGQVYDLLLALKKPGETISQLVGRLIELQNSSHVNDSKADTK